jgi:cellobiose phosphorylase
MYPYLTGSASWMVLTVLTQVFGVRGEWGDLILNPKLVQEEFDQDGRAQVQCFFAGQALTIQYVNEKKLDYGDYRMGSVFLNNKMIKFDSTAANQIRIKKSLLSRLSGRATLAVYLTDR